MMLTSLNRSLMDLFIIKRLRESHDHGGFAITPNSLTRISAFYNSTGRFVTWGGQLSVAAQCNFFPAHDLTDPDTWRAPNLDRLKQLREVLIRDYKCADPPADAPSSQQQQPPPPPQQQQQRQRQQSQDNGVLVLALLDQLASASAPSADKTVTTVPTQRRLTRQIVQNHAPFVALRQANQQTHLGEQRLLQSSQKYPAVADTSVLRGEMALLEPEDEGDEPRKLYYAPLTFLSHIGSHRIEWPLDLWRTFSPALLASLSQFWSTTPARSAHARSTC